MGFLASSRRVVKGGDGSGGGERWTRVRAAHATRVRDALGAPSAQCGGPRERGPHTCKGTILKGRAKRKNRSLKCNDIVLFNARLFKTGPSVFLEPARYFWRYQPFEIRPKPPLVLSPSFLAHARDEEEQIANYPLFPDRCCCSEVSSYTLHRFFYKSTFRVQKNIARNKTTRERSLIKVLSQKQNCLYLRIQNKKDSEGINVQ